MPAGGDIEPFFDIERAVEDYGKKMFKTNGRDRKQKRLYKRHFQDKVPCLDVRIDWSPLTTDHKTDWGKIKDEDFKPIAPDVTTTTTTDDDGDANDNTTTRSTGIKDDDTTRIDGNVLFRTDFTNNTGETQGYTLKIEKTTRSTCTTEIERGVTHGVELGATLSIGDVVELGAGYSREVSLTKTQGETIENELTWGAESTIVVPVGKAATAEMRVIEKKQAGNFVIHTTMAGYVRIKYYSLKNDRLIFSQTAKVATVVKDHQAEVKATGKSFRGLSFHDDGSVSFETKGRCSFRYGVRQVVKVVQTELDGTPTVTTPPKHKAAK